jgi:hypothetical protein
VVQDAFRENMGGQDKKTEKYLAVIKEKERITPGNLAKIFRVSGAAISGWAWKSIQAGMIEWCDGDGYHFVDDKALKKAKHQGIAYLKATETYQNETVKGLPTPFNLTGDSRWNEGGDLLKLYDLELEKRTAPSTVFTGVNPVFTPALNTVSEDEIINILEYFGDEPDGVRVFGLIPGGEGNNFEKAQEGPAQAPGNGHDTETQESEPGNGHGYGEGVGLDEETKTLAQEFSVLLTPKTTLTPHLCRKGCKHYDSVGDQNSVEFKEFCWMDKESRVQRDTVCKRFESKNPSLPEGVLTF